VRAENTRRSASFLRDMLRRNPDNFRVFGPDETTSNKLDAVYEASKKTWLADCCRRTRTAASSRRTAA
jgi:xylulose-5-phosphate/fructose-6-phosphate phosphoketolase